MQSLSKWFEFEPELLPQSAVLRIEAGEVVTYGQLSEMRRQLCSVFAPAAGSTRRVATLLERDAPLFATVLCAVQDGLTVVPLDPEFPQERLEYILQDCLPDVLIADRSVHPDLLCAAGLDAAGVPLVGAGLDGCVVFGRSSIPPRRTALKSSFLYLLYTSGSTGRPKGVEVPARVLGNLVAWQVLQQPVTQPGRRTLQFARPTFDVFFQEVLCTFAEHGILCPLPSEQRQNGPELGRYMQAHRIGRCFLPPTAVHLLSLADDQMYLPELRQVNVAGERLRVTRYMRAFFARHPRAELVNQYGPTETHVVTSHVLSGPAASWPDLPPVGKTISGVVASLKPLAGDQQMIDRGELAVSGACSGSRYVDHVRGASRGVASQDGRVTPYATGDLMRRDAADDLHFLGRLDNQIKWRGFRIEPAEIEGALLSSADVTAAAAIVNEVDALESYLVAYVVPASINHRAGLSEQLRRLCSASLPEQFVPSVVILVDKLPVSANGKIDRRALSQLPAFTDDTSSRRALNGMRTVADCLREVLPAQVLWDRSFSANGGASLAAARACALIRAHLAVDLTPGALLSARSLRQLCNDLDTAGATSPVAPGAPVSTLTAEETSMWFADLFDEPGRHHLATLRVYQQTSPEAVAVVLRKVTARHPALNTVYRDDGPLGPEAFVVDDLDLDITFAQMSTQALVNTVFYRSFDLSRGPLWRAQVQDLGGGAVLLLAVFHHICADGVSLQILGEELRTALSAAPEYSEQASSMAYREYAAWQRALETRQTYGVQRDKALARFEDLRGRHTGEWLEKYYGTTATRVSVKEPYADRVLSIAQREGVLESAVLMCALQRTLVAIGGDPSGLVVGIPFSRRPLPDLDRTVGNFVNMLPVRCPSQVTPHNCHAEIVHALESADVPFADIVKMVRPRRTSANPIFQVTLQEDLPSPADVTESSGIALVLPPSPEFRLCITWLRHRDDLLLSAETELLPAFAQQVLHGMNRGIIEMSRGM